MNKHRDIIYHKKRLFKSKAGQLLTLFTGSVVTAIAIIGTVLTLAGFLLSVGSPNLFYHLEIQKEYRSEILSKNTYELTFVNPTIYPIDLGKHDPDVPLTLEIKNASIVSLFASEDTEPYYKKKFSQFSLKNINKNRLNFPSFIIDGNSQFMLIIETEKTNEEDTKISIEGRLSEIKSIKKIEYVPKSFFTYHIYDILNASLKFQISRLLFYGLLLQLIFLLIAKYLKLKKRSLINPEVLNEVFSSAASLRALQEEEEEIIILLEKSKQIENSADKSFDEGISFNYLDEVISRSKRLGERIRAMFTQENIIKLLREFESSGVDCSAMDLVNSLSGTDPAGEVAYELKMMQKKNIISWDRKLSKESIVKLAERRDVSK